MNCLRFGLRKPYEQITLDYWGSECGLSRISSDRIRAVPTDIGFPLRFLVSESSQTSDTYFVYPVNPSIAFSYTHHSFRAWINPTSKKEGHCDITARTVLLYVLFCLTYMYCTLYILYILHIVHTVHVSLFPSFPCLSDVEASSSTSVHACSYFSSHSLSLT